MPCNLIPTPAITIFSCSALLYAGSIVGTARNAQSLKPLNGVTVTIEEANLTASSGKDGSYLFDSIPPGTYTLLFAKDGYEPVSRNDVYMAGEGEKRVDIDMLPQIFKLDKMVVRSTSFRKSSDMATSTKVMNFDEILRAPGALVDIQRVVQNLPSVASGGDNVNEVVVRGGAPGENLLVMDNIEIPNANHFADQGSGGGVISLINPLLVNGLTFNAGAPPAQYGGKASSVIDVKLRDGNNKIILGGIDLGMAGVGGHIEGPLWPKATFMASGHKSYLDFMAKFDPAVAVPEFWGLQAKISQQAGTGKIYANGIFGKNSITINNAVEDLNMDYDVIKSGGFIYASGISWDAYWGDRFSTRLVLSGTGNSFDRLAFTPDAADTGYANSSVELEQTLKAEAAVDFGVDNRLLIGGYGRRCDFDIDVKEKENIDSVLEDRADVHEDGYKYGGYLSCIFHAFNRLRTVPGVRLDGFTTNNSFTVSPRISAVLSVTQDLDLTSAFGVQYQQPDYIQLAMDDMNRSLKPKRAVTGILGLEYYVNSIETKLTVEGFYKQYNNLSVDSAIRTPDTLDESDVLLDIQKGRSFGIELFVQKKLTKTAFYSIAYSFSKSLYEDVRPFSNGWYSGDYDFINSLTITGGCKLELLQYEWYKRLHKKLWFRILSPFMPLADRIELSGKWRFLGGRPYTEKYYMSDNDSWYDSDKLNGSRFPPYHRLDFRFERRYGFGFLHMIYYFDFQNIYNRKNIWMYAYSDRFHRKQPVYQLPFFPAGGIIIGF